MDKLANVSLKYAHLMRKLTRVKKMVVALLVTTIMILPAFAQQKNDIAVIGYFAGRATALDSFPVQKLTHLIFSFCHLKGDRL